MPYKKRKFSSKKGDYNRKQYRKSKKFIGEDNPFHISFDVDCLDPEQLFTSTNKRVIPYTGTVVKNGLEFYRTKEIFDALLDLPNLLNIDISELNLGLCNEEYYNSSLENFMYFFDKLFTKIKKNEFTDTVTAN